MKNKPCCNWKAWAKDFNETMIKPKTENPLKVAINFKNMQWSLIFNLKPPSDVIHEHFREDVPKLSLDKM